MRNHYESSTKNSILLPIKPKFVEKIFNGQKRFEYRKRLCNQEIQKIFVYSTHPVKKVVGEVEVIDKIVMEKEELWEYTSSFAGITYEEYINYFGKNLLCSAYQLGDYVLYDEPKFLEDYGIHYPPQSFVYINEL